MLTFLYISCFVDKIGEICGLLHVHLFSSVSCLYVLEQMGNICVHISIIRDRVNPPCAEFYPIK